jgi:ABC-type sugar transport system substrate-binding protein
MAQPKRILASFLSEDQEFQQLQAEDARQAAQRASLRIDVLFADNNAVLQIQQLYHAIHAPAEERPCAIVVETVAGEGFERVARNAAAAGVGWVLINRSVGYLDELRRQYPALPFSSVGTDHVQVGHIQGEQLKVLAPGGGPVICVQGPADTSVAQERLQGLQAAIEHAPFQLKVLEGQWTEASGAQALRRWFRLDTARACRPAAVVCQNDAMAMGARTALHSQDPTGDLARVPTLGCDGLPTGGRRLVDAGELAATVITPSNGGPAVELVARALATGTAPPTALRLAPTPYPSLEELARRSGTRRRPA